MHASPTIPHASTGRIRHDLERRWNEASPPGAGLLVTTFPLLVTTCRCFIAMACQRCRLVWRHAVEVYKLNATLSLAVPIPVGRRYCKPHRSEREIISNQQCQWSTDRCSTIREPPRPWESWAGVVHSGCRLGRLALCSRPITRYMITVNAAFLRHFRTDLPVNLHSRTFQKRSDQQAGVSFHSVRTIPDHTMRQQR
jgi:hypothetical protein